MKRTKCITSYDRCLSVSHSFSNLGSNENEVSLGRVSIIVCVEQHSPVLVQAPPINYSNPDRELLQQAGVSWSLLVLSDHAHHRWRMTSVKSQWRLSIELSAQEAKLAASLGALQREKDKCLPEKRQL